MLNGEQLIAVLWLCLGVSNDRNRIAYNLSVFFFFLKYNRIGRCVLSKEGERFFFFSVLVYVVDLSLFLPVLCEWWLITTY